MSKASDDDIILEELARQRPARPVVWRFFFLALACFIAKAHYLNSLFKFSESKRRFDWLQQLAGITQRDAAFVIIAGLASAGLLALTRRFDLLNKWLYRLIRLFVFLCLIYLIAAAAAFDFTRSFPTCSLWYQLG